MTTSRPDQLPLGWPKRIGQPLHGIVREGTLTLPNGKTKFMGINPGQSLTLVRSPRAAAAQLTETEIAQEAERGYQWLTHAFLVGWNKLLGGDWAWELGQYCWLFCTANHTWLMRFAASGDFNQTVSVYAREFGVFGRTEPSEEYLAGTGTFVLKSYSDVPMPAMMAGYGAMTHSETGAISVINAGGDYATFWKTYAHVGALRIDLSEAAGVVSAGITTLTSGSQVLVIEEVVDPYLAYYATGLAEESTAEQLEDCVTGSQIHWKYSKTETLTLNLVVETEPNPFTPRSIARTTTKSFGGYVTPAGVIGNVWTKLVENITREPYGSIGSSGGTVDWDTYEPCSGGSGPVVVGGGCISREATIGSLYTNERTWTSWAGYGWVYKDTKQVEETQWVENCYGETPSASAGTKDKIEFQSIYLDGVLKQTYDFITAEGWKAPDFDVRWATWDIWPATPTSVQIWDCYRAILSSASVSNQVYSGVSRVLSGLTFNRDDGNGAYVVWNPVTNALVRSANPVWVV